MLWRYRDLFLDREPPRTWHVHIGAHKTATTHLQDMLAALQHRVVDDDVEILVPDTIRHRMNPVFTGIFLNRKRCSKLSRIAAGIDLRRRVRPALGSGRRVVLSEENILGTSADLLAARGCYPVLERRLEALAALFGPHDDVTLYLSVRSFDRVLPGAYATALRFPSPQVRHMDAVRKSLRRAPPAWIDLVNRIRRTVPQATLRVWRQEDYGEDPAPMLQALFDRPLGDLPEIPRPASTLTPSAAGVAQAEAAIAAGLSMQRHRQEIEAIYAAHSISQDAPRYMPFDADERHVLNAQYVRDIDRIKSEFPGMLIDTH